MGFDMSTGTSMRYDSVYDQFVCRFWLSRWPLWSLLVASTYSILVLTVERYVAIVYPVVYKVSPTIVVSVKNFDITSGLRPKI